jgi:hypothetical protein
LRLRTAGLYHAPQQLSNILAPYPGQSHVPFPKLPPRLPMHARFSHCVKEHPACATIVLHNPLDAIAPYIINDHSAAYNTATNILEGYHNMRPIISILCRTIVDNEWNSPLVGVRCGYVHTLLAQAACHSRSPLAWTAMCYATYTMRSTACFVSRCGH